MSSMQSEIGPITRPQQGGRPGRGWLWFGLGLAIVMIGLLIGPRVPDGEQAQRCVQNVRLAGPFGTHINCDSPEFLRQARDQVVWMLDILRNQGPLALAGAWLGKFTKLVVLAAQQAVPLLLFAVLTVGVAASQ